MKTTNLLLINEEAESPAIRRRQAVRLVHSDMFAGVELRSVMACLYVFSVQFMQQMKH